MVSMSRYKDEFFDELTSRIKYKEILPSVKEEMNTHVEELAEELMLKGVEEDEAYKEAVKRMGNPEEIAESLNKTYKPVMDKHVLILTIVLSLFGFFILREINTLDEYPLFSARTQIVSMCLGFGIMVLLAFADYKKLEKYSVKFYLATLVCILICIKYTDIGFPYNAKKRWISIPFIQDGNSIFISLLIVFFAGAASKYSKEGTLKSIITLLGLAVLPAFIYSYSTKYIFLVCTVLFAMIIYSAILNMSRKNKFIVFGVIGVLIAGFIILLLNNSFIFNRLFITLNAELDPYGMGYRVVVARDLLGSAKIYGPNELNGVNYGRIPFMLHTENVLITIIVRYGWAISLAIVTALFIFLHRIFLISHKTADSYGKILSFGIFTLFVFEIVINVAMNLTIIPFTSINLSFFSYGGSSFVANMALIGMLLSIYRRKNLYACLE